MRTGVAAGNDAGGVDAGYGGEYGVVALEEDAFVGESGEVGREVGADLGGLESIECGDEDGGHGEAPRGGVVWIW